MKILAIDTAFNACSVALLIRERVIEQFEIVDHKHFEKLQPMINHLLVQEKLKLTNLTGLAFNCGPGSFSGLRIACSFMQGLSAATGLPVVAISSLQAIAYQYLLKNSDAIILSCFSAGSGQVYFGAYYFDQMQPDSKLTTFIQDSVTTIDDLMSKGQSFFMPDEIQNLAYKPVIFVGNGWKIEEVKQYWIKLFKPIIVDDDSLPHAREIALLASEKFNKKEQLLSFDQIQPIYLRDKIALNLEEQIALRKQKIK